MKDIDFRNVILSPPTVPAEWDKVDKKAELAIAMLSTLPEKWLKLAANKFKCAEQETFPMGKRLIEHGAINNFNCANQLKSAIEAGQPVFDLLREVFQQDAERPRRRWLYDVVLGLFPDALIHYGIRKILARPSKP